MAEQQNPIKDAIGFLKYLTACWPNNVFLHVEAMTPVKAKSGKPDIQRMTVATAEVDKLATFTAHYKERNCYYTVNPLSGPSGTGEGGAVNKADIACAACVHLDLDPAEPPEGADLQKHHKAERLRLRQQLDDFTPAPSWLVDSGGGFQAFWRLVTPATVVEAEAINKALCLHFKTPDSCHSAQHLMRLPFTQNVPGYKKLAKGRTQVQTRLLTTTDVAYTLDDFAFLPRAAATPGKQLAVTGDLPPRFVELLAVDEDLQRRWEGNPDGMDDQSRNALDMSITSMLVHRGFSDAEVSQILHGFPLGKVVQDGRGADYITTMLKLARAQRHLSRDQPQLTAYRLLAERFTSPDGVRLLRHWNGVFYAYQGGAYQERDEKGVRAEAWQYLGGARQYLGKDKKTGKTKTEPFKPNRARAGDVLGALEAVTYQDSRFVQPCWMDGADGADPRDLLVMSNGVLNLRARTLQAHDPRLFTTTALPFAYMVDSGPPRAWLAFLASAWGSDAEAIQLLQEFFGYILSPDRSQQKILLIIGPPRSGKGTILRVLGALVGAANCCSPSMEKLAERFGLEPLVDKTLAIFPDVRLDGRTSQKALSSVLLPISGQDQQTFDRKYKPAYTGTLGVQFVMSSNELPMILDSSGALSSRFKVLQMFKSFVKQEDTGLTAKLLAELPAILNWSLDGLDRLQKRGAFVQPQSAMEMVEDLADSTSPIKVFVDECCVIGPSAAVDTTSLYNRWKMWCDQQGRYSPGTQAVFGRDLKAAFPGIRKAQSRTGGERRRDYVGIRIATGTSKLEDLKGVTSKGTAAVADLDAEREKRKALLL